MELILGTKKNRSSVILRMFMQIIYLTVLEAVAKYNLTYLRVKAAIRNAKNNGLYKCIYKERERIHFREDYFKEWLKENDVVSPYKRPKEINCRKILTSKKKRNWNNRWW